MKEMKLFNTEVMKQIEAQSRTRQTLLKQQLKAATDFPKELKRALPVYSALCELSWALPSTMGESGYSAIDDAGERGRKEFDAAQDAIDKMIVAIVVYLERLWSASFGFREHGDSDNEFWEACPEFYKLSGLDGGWKQYVTAWDNHVSRENTARRGKALIDNWKRERVKARSVVDKYRRWWNAFWKAHPELAAQYEDRP